MRSMSRYLQILAGLLTIIILIWTISETDDHRDDGSSFQGTNQIDSESRKETNLHKFEYSQCKKNSVTKDLVLNLTLDQDNQGQSEKYRIADENFYTKFHPQYNFSGCSMQECFDFSRCLEDGPIRIHIVPSRLQPQKEASNIGESNIIHENILRIIRQSKHYEPDEERACLLYLEDDTLDRDPLSKSFRSNLGNIFDQSNQYGVNHLAFNLYSGSWAKYKEDDFAGLNFAAAILAKASNSFRNHRPRFDVSLPLFSYLHPMKDDGPSESWGVDSALDDNRTFFLTFKGKRYVIGTGSETRNSLYHLDNKRDVIMLTTCRHGKKWRESSDRRCFEDETNYNEHEFVDLMKESTFCLVPRGRRLGSFRFLEALSHGCIPVVLSDGWVMPFDEIIDWTCAAIQFDEELVLQVPDLLRDIDEETVKLMRRNCKMLYKEYFASMEKIILTTLSIIEQRVKSHLANGYT